MYDCPLCMRRFNSERDWAKHAGAKHPNSLELKKYIRAAAERRRIENDDSEADRLIDRMLGF